MQSIALVELGIGGDALQEKRIKDDAMSRGKRRINGVERAHIVGAHVARRGHAGEQDRNMPGIELAEDGVQRRLGGFRVDAAQSVIGAQLENNGIGVVRHRPVESTEPARGGVARYAGIDDRDRMALGLERGLEPGGEGGAGGQAETGGERIPEGHDFEHTVGGVRSVRRVRATTTTISTSAKRWTQTAEFPYERGCERRGRMTNTFHAGPAVALAGVNLSLGHGAARVHILKDIALDIGQGEAFGLIGPSGSGKSTLLMVMAGLERPDTGTVRVAGNDLCALDEDALARFRGRQVGIVFQSFHLIPTMTALENVAVPLELAGAGDAQARARDELSAVGLARPAASLSGAIVRRRAATRRARARAGAGAGDPGGRRADRQSRRGHRPADHRSVVCRPRERGTTLVLVTHDAALATRCARVARLRSGRIDGVGAP